MVTFIESDFEIIKLAVTPLSQNKGIGNSLLVHFLDQIPKNSSVFLDVRVDQIHRELAYIKKMGSEKYILGILIIKTVVMH